MDTAHVIPEKCLLHFLAFLPHQADPRPFFEALSKRRPGLATPGGWRAVAAPRPCAFGPVEDHGYRFQVVLDLGQLPANSWKPGFGDLKMPAHQSHTLNFLLEAPPKASGLDRARATLELARAWIDAGATSVAFPSGGIVAEAEELRGVDPTTLDADKATALLISFAMMGKGSDGRTWLRTRGLSQFGLPDFCTAIGRGAQPSAEEIQGAQTLFASLAPYVISLDKPLKPGEVAKIGSRMWRAEAESALAAAPAAAGRLTPLTLVEG